MHRCGDVFISPDLPTFPDLYEMDMESNHGYDIIGDVHGHAHALERLLQRLGYARHAGVYRHPQGRQAIFVGDIIDRGPRIRETLHLVHDMVAAGHARMVLGNHEFNAICFHTPHLEKGGFFRDHSLKEIEQHIETLRQFKEFPKEWAHFLNWFKTLPFFLEMPYFNVVHAWWDPGHIQWLKDHYSGMDAAFLAQAANKTDQPPAYRVVEETLKGVEVKLPDGLSFYDKDGAERHECRMRWWKPQEQRVLNQDVLLECPEEIAKDAVRWQVLPEYTGAKRVFFGHYWQNEKPDFRSIRNLEAVCLDYSVAKGGWLTAARMDGPELTDLVYVKPLG